jgi:hypothetical protein
MIPIQTMNISRFGPVPDPAGPSWALLISKALGIQVVSIDGNILPITAIVLMFAAWGVWFFVLRLIDGVKELPVLYRKATKKEDEEIEE